MRPAGGTVARRPDSRERDPTAGTESPKTLLSGRMSEKSRQQSIAYADATGTRDGRRVLILFLVGAASLWVFALIAGLVSGGDSQPFDRWLLNALRSPGDLSDPLGPVWFEEAVRDITALGGSAVLTLVVIAVVGLLALVRRPKTILFLVLAVVGGLLLSLALKAGFDRPRPDFLVPGQRVYTASFPSGHSMNAAVVYLTLASIVACSVRRHAVKMYVMLTAIVVTMLVGLSRIYLGVHWPTDVFAGWSAGAGWAVFCWLLMHAMQARHLVESEMSESAQRGFGPPRA